MGDSEGIPCFERDSSHIGPEELSSTLEALGQSLSFEQVHDEEGEALLGTVEVVHGDDAGVTEGAGGRGLALEAFERLYGCVAQQDLERVSSSSADVAGPEHGAHAACAEHGFDLVGAAKESTDELRGILNADGGLELRGELDRWRASGSSVG